MALFIRQNEDRSKLQERLAAELQEKSKVRAAKANEADDVEDSQYLKDTKKTTNLAWVWLVIIAAFVFVAVMFMIQAM
jgi:hypothetical protein